jgi:hypothetical protein
MDDAWQIDANAGMSASEYEAKGLKGQKSQRNEAKSCVATEGFTQKSPHQTIRLCRSTDDELFRPSLSLSIVCFAHTIRFCTFSPLTSARILTFWSYLKIDNINILTIISF